MLADGTGACDARRQSDGALFGLLETGGLRLHGDVNVEGVVLVEPTTTGGERLRGLLVGGDVSEEDAFSAHRTARISVRNLHAGDVVLEFAQ